MALLPRCAGLVAVVALTGSCAGVMQGRPSGTEPSEEARREAMQYFVSAKVFESQGNPLGAIVALRSAADLDPSSPTIHAQLARNYDRIRDYRMAAHFARRALALDPELTALRYQLLRWLDSVGTPPEVGEQLEELIDRDPHNWQLYSYLARIYMETGREARIDPLFDRLLDQEETPVDVRVNVGYVLSRSGRRERAEAVFRQILAADPGVEDAWLGLGELQVARGDGPAALTSLQAGARHVPDSSSLMYELGRLLETVEQLTPILEAEDAAYLYRLGIALSEMEKYPLAAAVFERIVGGRPARVDGWLDPARYYLHVGRPERAEGILREAVEAMPDSLELYLFWGAALEEEDRPEEALAVYEQAAGRLPESLDVYLAWGGNLESRRLWDEAIGVYRRGLAAGGPEAPLYGRWGLVLGRQQLWTEAIERYRQAVEADSTLMRVHLRWGVALQNLGRWDEAIARMTRAVDLDAGGTRALFYLGSLLEEASRESPGAGYFERAVDCFRQVLALQPDDAYALNYLGYSFADRGVHLEEAVQLLTRAVAIEPDNGAFFDSLGWAYYRLGELEEAERYLSRALEAMDDHDTEEQAVILDHAGDIADALGKRDEAEVHWRRVLDLTPENEEVREKLEARPSP